MGGGRRSGSKIQESRRQEQELEATPGTAKAQEILLRIQQSRSQEQEDTLGKARLCMDTATEEPGAGAGGIRRQEIRLRRSGSQDHIRLRIQQRGRPVARAAYNIILYSVLFYYFFKIYTHVMPYHTLIKKTHFLHLLFSL